MAEKNNRTEPDYREILVSLIGSITSADDLGDVSNNVTEAIKQAKIDIGKCDELNNTTYEYHYFIELAERLHNMGVTDLKGAELTRIPQSQLDYIGKKLRKETTSSPPTSC